MSVRSVNIIDIPFNAKTAMVLVFVLMENIKIHVKNVVDQTFVDMKELNISVKIVMV